MGKLALAAKITHVPSMYLSELPGPRQGSRQAAIDGHLEISRRCRALGVDTIVVFDSHWLVNAASGTGQINAIFPVTPQTGAAVPQPVASSAQRYQASGRL